MITRIANIILLVLVALFSACRSNKRKEITDNQIQRFLEDENISFYFTIGTGRTGDGKVNYYSKARDNESSKAFQFPGVAFIDDEPVVLTKQGFEILNLNMKQKSDSFEGKHQLRVMFSSDMLYDWDKRKLKNQNQDSIVVNFETTLFKIASKPIFKKDSVFIRLNKHCDSCYARFTLVPVNKNRKDTSSSVSETQTVWIKDGLISAPILERGTSYYLNLTIGKELPVFYKGREKGVLNLWHHIEFYNVK